MQPVKLKIAGLMSGTSLDGLDIALCEFWEQDAKVNFKFIAGETINYQQDWKERLQHVFKGSTENYFKLNSLYGHFIAESITTFLLKHQQKADYIASHGHTVFHRPELGFTTQIGCGATIAAQTGIDTICDFRSLDVALKGQGAPLVPIGDRDLFNAYESCLNMGGIANISFTKNDVTHAFDICFVNMALNYLAEQIGQPFDDGGKLASTGICNNDLLHSLLAIETDYKSLGRELFETDFLPLLNNKSISIADKLATCVEYSVMKIKDCLVKNDLKSVLVTGGGAYNTFLIDKLKTAYSGTIEIPTDDIIQFKEAIVFGYLGYLRVMQKPNTLCSVTGSHKNSIGGCIYKGL